MAIQHHYTSVHVHDNENQEEELNRFLRAHRIVTVSREFVNCGRDSFWALSVEYLDGPPGTTGKETDKHGKKEKVDYKDLLPPDDFVVFVRLRDWRKEQALKEAVPAYTIFTNEQLARIVQTKVMTKADLGKIDGVGDARVEKYGSAVLSVLMNHEPPFSPEGVS